MTKYREIIRLAQPELKLRRRILHLAVGGIKENC